MVKMANAVFAEVLDHTQHYTICPRKPKLYIKIWLQNPKDKSAYLLNCIIGTMHTTASSQRLWFDCFFPIMYPPSSTQNSEELTYSK
jgi:hypothetical protein